MEMSAATLFSSSSFSSPPSIPRQILSSSSLAIPRPIQSVVRRSSHGHGFFTGAKMSTVALEASLVMKNKASQISNELKGSSIFLIGMNCTMKTNLGKLLADSLRYYYFDSDSLVEQAAGAGSDAKSLRERDEKAFRDSETEVLKQLSSMGRLVVCAVDGAVQSSTNLALMRYGISIWIDVPFDKLVNEVLKTEIPSTVAQATSDTSSFSKVLEEISSRYNEMKEGYETSDARVSLQKVASQLGYEDLDCVTPHDMVMEVNFIAGGGARTSTRPRVPQSSGH